MSYLVSASLVIVGIIHLLPVTGALSADRLSALYGIPVDDPNLELLMRHRAVLFGLLGAFLLYAAFQPALQIPAFIAGFVSVGSFLVLGWSIGADSAGIGRVVRADLFALGCLVIGAIASVLALRGG